MILYIYIHLLLDRIDFTVRCAKLMEGISYFMILYFVFFQQKKTPSQKPWSRTPAPRGVDGIGGLDWGILHHMFFLLVDHSTKNTKWFIKGNSTWFWVLHFWEIWTLHTRHLSVSSSHLLDHSPFTSTLGNFFFWKIHCINLDFSMWSLCWSFHFNGWFGVWKIGELPEKWGIQYNPES